MNKSILSVILVFIMTGAFGIHAEMPNETTSISAGADATVWHDYAQSNVVIGSVPGV